MCYSVHGGVSQHEKGNVGGGVSQNAMGQAGGVVCIPEYNRQADGVVCIPECNGAGSGWCEAGGTHPTGMHPCYWLRTDIAQMYQQDDFTCFWKSLYWMQ